MSDFLCALWPWLFGGLLGWLAAGWLARATLRRRPRVVDRIVEKLVDNPVHLTRIAELEARPPQVVEKVVEKIVDRPVDRIVDRPVDRIVEKIVEKPVDRVVEKLVDNPAHLTRIAELEARPPQVVEKVVEKIVVKSITDTRGIEERDRQLADWQTRYSALQAQLAEIEVGHARAMALPAYDAEAARRAGFKLRNADDLTIVEGIGPKIAGLLNAAGILRFAELARRTPLDIQPILDRAGANFTLADPETWPEQADLAARNRWMALRYLQDGLNAGRRRKSKRVAAKKSAVVAIDLAAAKAAGFRLRGPDDLTIVEGIGPKISGLLNKAGVYRFIELAGMKSVAIQIILDKAGARYMLADPQTWPQQAALAARNKWVDLRDLQASLDGGRTKARRSGSKK